MTIYLIMLVIILIMSAVFRPERKENGKIWFIVLSFILLTFVSGMRSYSVGVDTKQYVSYFLLADKYSFSNTRFEIGYIIYLKILRFFTKDPGVYLFVSSFICIGSVCFFIYKFSKKPTVSILLYILLGYYFSQMNILRQALALSFSLIAFSIVLDENAKEKYRVLRIIISLAFLLIALGFHNMMFIVFVPWIMVIRKSKKEFDYKHTIQHIVLITLFIAIATFLGYSLTSQFVSILLPNYSNFYYNSQWGESNYFGALFTALISIVFMFAGAIALRGRILTKLQRFAAIMIGFYVVFCVLSMRMEIWNRVAGFFGIYISLIWVPEFLDVIENRNNLLITEGAIMVGSFLYMLIVLIFRPEWSGVVPYIFRGIAS